ncbi:hypothetical protein TNIN_228771 [Trichonephila inaurata madagascariensis]|uniref:Uncharacterized protein n=1 Tax=Trichonephila inaurata madagascariensis TaxID=2747483 RepID=A0A8X6XQ86_9ARAC|nr:hypothetical protein TNIN_228771 [Trichonephila inaurata madagascariensis]
MCRLDSINTRANSKRQQIVQGMKLTTLGPLPRLRQDFIHCACAVGKYVQRKILATMARGRFKQQCSVEGIDNNGQRKGLATMISRRFWQLCSEEGIDNNGQRKIKTTMISGRNFVYRRPGST